MLIRAYKFTSALLAVTNFWIFIIAHQNHLRYVLFLRSTDYVLNGVYALLNSTLFDTYYRVLDGSTQVNSTEINNCPFFAKRNLLPYQYRHQNYWL